MSSRESLFPIGERFKSLLTYEEGFHDEAEIKKMIYTKFGNTGLETSLLGLGCSGLATYCGAENENEGIETVVSAVRSGINYIDTAPFYGQGRSEIIIGKALKQIPRNAYYLATKVGRYGPNLFDFSAHRTLKSVEESLCRLGVESFDILQVHDLEFSSSIDIIVNETLPALQKMKECGKTKLIGITGYPLCILKEVLERSPVCIDVVLSYCRCTLFDNSLNSYIPFLKSKNVAVVNAAVMGMGLLTHPGPPDWHPASSKLKILCEEAARYCKEKNVDISKLAVGHSLFHPDIDVHLVGMENQTVLRENLSSLKSLVSGFSTNEKFVKEEVMRFKILRLSMQNLIRTHLSFAVSRGILLNASFTAIVSPVVAQRHTFCM